MQRPPTVAGAQMAEQIAARPGCWVLGGPQLCLLGVCFYLDSTKHLFKVTGDWRNNTDKIVECFIDIRSIQ